MKPIQSQARNRKDGNQVPILFRVIKEKKEGRKARKNEREKGLRKSKTGSNEPEKRRGKGRGKAREEQDFIMNNNNVMAEKREKKIEKMTDLCRTLL